MAAAMSDLPAGMETVSADLVEFLNARLDEDEAVAEEALDRGFGGWEYFADHGVNYEARSHIARHHPARALAEVEAKRQIIVLVADMFDEEWHTGYTCGAESGYVAVLELLALPYAAHPDYRQEWKL